MILWGIFSRLRCFLAKRFISRPWPDIQWICMLMTKETISSIIAGEKFEFLFGFFNITAFINIHLLNVCLNNFYNSGFDTKSTTIKSSNQFSAVTSHILHFLSSCVSEYSSAVLYYCFFKDIVGQGKSQIMRDLSSYDNWIIYRVYHWRLKTVFFFAALLKISWNFPPHSNYNHG